MTYEELLVATAKRKEEVIRKLNKALNGDLGFLVKAEIEMKPMTTAYLWLAEEFCETLAEHVDEFIEQADECDQFEISDIYMAYYDGRMEDLFEHLPVEANLFKR